MQADGDAIATRLGQAIRFRTVSHQDPQQIDLAQFAGLRDFLTRTYSAAHAALQHEAVAELSLLYTWPGEDPTLEPVLLLAHQDVVLVENESAWTHPPFSGHLAGGAVWGRGAIDDKGRLVALFESVELLVREGFRPRRSVYLALGHDEEVGGVQGATALARVLAARAVKPQFILDEGGAILIGVVPGTDRPVAMIGTAEKGHLTIELKVSAAGGHASMPPSHTAVGILSRAIARLEEHPFPARLTRVPREMLEALSRETGGIRGLAIRNLWLTERFVRRQLLANPDSAAMLRTTTAATMFHSGVKENLLPREAAARVNIRILPGDSTAGAIQRVREVIDDPTVSITANEQSRQEPPPPADTRSNAFDLIRRTIAQVAPDALIVPGLVLGMTDSRHYSALTANIFRFSPMRISKLDVPLIHGTDERLSLENCALMVQFYVQLLRNAAK